MRISIIAAMDEKTRAIGINNQLPDWKTPGDLARFHSLTDGKIVIMGRRTFESLPGRKPLSNRFNIVISTTIKTSPGLHVVSSFANALCRAKTTMHINPEICDEVMIIGGQCVYEEALSMATKIYLTSVHNTTSYSGNVFFPRFSEDEWKLLFSEKCGETHSYHIYTRELSKETENLVTPNKDSIDPKESIPTFKELGNKLGSLVDKKNEAYGNAFDDCGEFLRILYPTGMKPEQYADALSMVRIFDKMKRIATNPKAFKEDPYEDIAGYGLLGMRRNIKEKSKE